MSTAVASTHLDAERAAALLTDVQQGRRGAFDELVRLCEPFVRCQATVCAWRRDDCASGARRVRGIRCEWQGCDYCICCRGRSDVSHRRGHTSRA